MENTNCSPEPLNLLQDAKKPVKKESTKSNIKPNPAEMLKLIQELKGENEYLNLLNKEHLRARNKTAITSNKHTELYDNAASGYFTLSRKGIINDLNLIGWEMLGRDVPHLINTFFDFYLSEDSRPTFQHFLEKVFNSSTATTCELTFVNADHLLNYAQLTGIIAENKEHCYITAVDITGRKLAEELLIKEKIRLSAIIEGSNVGTWEQNFLTGEVFYDNSYLEMLGYTLDEILPTNIDSWKRFTHPDDVKISDEIYERHVKNEVDYYECEIRMKHKNGDWIWILDKGKINQRDKNGKPLFISGTHQNITERKLAEESLRLSKITYRGILNSVAELIYIQDENGCFLDVNKATEKMYGYNREYFIGKTPEFLSAPGKNDYDKILKAIHLAWAGKPQSFEFWGITKEGRIFPKDVNLSLGTYFGKPAIIAVARDISERKQAEEKLLYSENRYRLLVESANEGVLVGQGNKLKFVNSKIIEFSGYTMEELLSRPFMELLHPDYQGVVMSNYLKRLNGEEVADKYEAKILNKNGTSRWVELSGVIIDWEGKPASMIFISDICQRKQTERFQSHSNEILEILNSNLDLKEVIDAVLTSIQKEMDFSAVGIRLKVGDDYPYFSQNGFSKYFIKKENTLIAKDANGDICRDSEGKIILECTCGSVMSGKTDHTNPLFTKAGSFWTNNSYPLLDVPRDQDPRFQPRNTCIHFGFGSVALIPIRTNEMIVGTLQLNDKKKDIFTHEMIVFYEGIGLHIANVLMRKQTEDALKQSEERYRSLVESSLEPLVVHRDGVILYANPSAINTVQTDTLHDLTGKRIIDMIHPDHHQIIMEHMKKLVNVGDFTPLEESQFLKLDGTTIDVEVQAKVINYDGEPAIQASIRDITYKKELETNLIKVSKIARLGVWGLNLTNYKFNISGITKDILELEDDFETDLENVFARFNLEKKKEEIFNVIIEGIENGKKWELELNFKTAKGNDLWVKIIGETEYINGKPIRINGSFQDINERKMAEITLQKNRKELEDYKFALDECAIIAITDEKGIIKNVNDNFCQISGYSREELVGNTHRLINSKFHSKAFFKEMWSTILSGKIWRGIIKNKKKNGEYYWVDSTFVPFLDANNTPSQFLAIRFDVTEIKMAEDEILKAKEKAEESDRLKSAFLANMSHEIRTPMNGILGFTNLLKEANLSSEDQQEYIKIIDQSGARLLNIINDIIDISKIESNQMMVSISETNINEKIEYIYNFFKPETSRKGIHLSFKNNLPINESIINTDSEKVNAVLVNLVKNAIKFCDKGTIDFGYRLKTEKEKAELEFYVKDSGVGIPDDRQKAIFDRFIQADISDKRAFQGAGLGLSISKAYVEMLGGKIWLESKVGTGSTFYFTIPYTTASKAFAAPVKTAQETESENHIKNLKILIVEDDPISKLLISKAVASFSKEMIRVSSGIQAVEACQNNPDINLVMMDINMPGMNGYEATELIRKFNKEVIIIAQTANAFTSDKNEAIAAGCNDYISKPINKDLLIHLIQKYFY